MYSRDVQDVSINNAIFGTIVFFSYVLSVFFSHYLLICFLFQDMDRRNDQPTHFFLISKRRVKLFTRNFYHQGMWAGRAFSEAYVRP